MNEKVLLILIKAFGYVNGNAPRLSLSLDKKDITLSELNACERLLEYTKDASDDKEIIESEIAELRMTLDLLP